MPSFHVVCFFDEVDETLWLHESVSKFLVVANTCIFVKVKDLMSSGVLKTFTSEFGPFIALGRSHSGAVDILSLSIPALLLEEIFKVVDHINHEVQKQLFYF